jgi:hypothetical protein
MKSKSLRGNNCKFITKEIRHATMVRSKLRNKYLKTRAENDRILYSKQRNVCLSLLKKAKRAYFNNLNTKDITDNKKFWTTVFFYFSGNPKLKVKIMLIEKEEIISDDQKVAEVFNNYFNNIVPNLNIEPYISYSECINGEDPVLSAVRKYEKHPSIIAIKNKFPNSKFSFQVVNEEKISQLIKNLDPKKSSQKDDIPIKILKSNTNVLSSILTNNFNDCLVDMIFPPGLKDSEITPIFKKGDRTDKAN